MAKRDISGNGGKGHGTNGHKTGGEFPCLYHLLLINNLVAPDSQHLPDQVRQNPKGCTFCGYNSVKRNACESFTPYRHDLRNLVPYHDEDILYSDSQGQLVNPVRRVDVDVFELSGDPEIDCRIAFSRSNGHHLNDDRRIDEVVNANERELYEFGLPEIGIFDPSSNRGLEGQDEEWEQRWLGSKP